MPNYLQREFIVSKKSLLNLFLTFIHSIMLFMRSLSTLIRIYIYWALYT